MLNFIFSCLSHLNVFKGLADEDRKMLIENVSIIFNGAASVRFDDPLKGAILMNTRATREIIYLALEMKKLEVRLFSTLICFKYFYHNYGFNFRYFYIYLQLTVTLIEKK